MNLIPLTQAMLQQIIKKAIILGETKRDIELSKIPPHISRNKANKIYHKATVNAWIKSGVIKEYPDIGRGKTNAVRLSVIELQTAALSCNLIRDLSEKDKAEARRMYGEI